MYCEYCKAKFRLKENIINHINIVQEIQTHNFCSKRCKEAWQKDVSESNLRKIIVWDVSSTLGTFYFKRGTEYDYLSPFAIKYSYFSKNLVDLGSS